MGQASMRKWLRRVKHALDHCPWCGAALKVNFHSRWLECPEHGEAASVVFDGSALVRSRSAGSFGEFQWYELSRPSSLRSIALASRARRRSERRAALAMRNGKRWDFAHARVTFGGVEVRGVKSISYEPSRWCSSGSANG